MNVPRLVEPRLDVKPWGGNRLACWLHQRPVEPNTGEAIFTARDVRIVSDSDVSITLGSLLDTDPVGLLGEEAMSLTLGYPEFPFLIKLIDAEQDLSIQVHPDDNWKNCRRPGKTEAWYVLDVAEGGVLYLGMADPTQSHTLAASAMSGTSVAAFIRPFSPRQGDVYFVPAGAIHAIGKGMVVYEVQQPSDVTLRLNDWGRVDANGASRDLHVTDALAVADFAYVCQPSVADPAQMVTRRVSCPKFALDEYRVPVGSTTVVSPNSGPSALTLVQGHGMLAWENMTKPLSSGDTCLTFNNGPVVQFTASSNAVLLRAAMPDELVPDPT